MTTRILSITGCYPNQSKLDSFPADCYRVIEVDFEKIHDPELLAIEGRAIRDADYYTMMPFSPLLQTLVRIHRDYAELTGLFVKAKTLAGALHGFQQVDSRLPSARTTNFLSLLKTVSIV